MQNKCVLTNPKYIQMIKLCKSVRWTDRDVTIPLLLSEHMEAPNKTTIKLYPDQVEVFDKIKDQSTCLLEAITGAGKTVIAIALHQVWGGRTLVVCHTLLMVNQFSSEFKKFTNIKPTLFCGGKKDQTGAVVITTLTSFRKNSDEFLGFDNLIVDEADLAMTDKTLEAIAEFWCIRKHGFTGTTESVYDECNPQEAPVLAKFWGHHVIHTSPKKSVLKEVVYYTYNKIYPEVFPHKDWVEFREVLDNDVTRKKEQIDFILRNTESNGYTLALWDRVADIEDFYDAFKRRGETVYMSTGEMKTDERQKHLLDFKETGGYLLGVSSTLNRGYDNTSLTKAFIMHPLKKANPLRQSIGRILRHMEGKESFLYLWSDSMLLFQLEKQKEIIEHNFNVPITEEWV